MKKFLCVCDGGNVRSAALAYVLRCLHHQEAIAIGRHLSSPATLRYLCEWADVIVLMQPHMDESIPPEFATKLRCVDVGPDRYGVYVHPELLPQVKAGAEWLLA